MTKYIQRDHWRHKALSRTNELQLDKNVSVDPKLEQFINNNFNTNNMCMYPDIYSGYQHLAALTGLHAERLCLSTGADQALNLILKAFEKVGNLYMMQPTFAMPGVYANIYQYNLNHINYHYYEKKNIFVPDHRLFTARAGLLYIASPDSQTGYTFSVEQVKILCECYSQVILDNTYSMYSDVIYDYEELVDMYPNLLIVNSFSKNFNTPGIRIGYCYSNEDNIKNIFQYKPMYEISSIACDYIEFVLDNKDVFFKSIKRLKKFKTYMTHTHDCVSSVSGNFVVIKNWRYRYNNIISRQFQVNDIYFDRLSLTTKKHFKNNAKTCL